VKGRPTGVLAIGAVLGLLFGAVGLPSVALADATRDGQWHLRFLDVAAAQKISQGAGVTVAVVDTGVDGTHPDLVGNVAQGTETFVGSKGGNGWNDDDGHGTRMAGLIAAHGHSAGNGAGALGIAPKATVLPVRAGTIAGPTSIGPAIKWTTDHGARVVSVSAGGLDVSEDLRKGVEYAIAHDVVVIAAAGNSPKDTQVIYPAAYPGVLAVAGVDQNGDHPSVSVTGPEVALSAPAVGIVSTSPGGRYGTASGTSDATAIVAGAAALVRAKFPNLSAVEVIHRLTATAIDKGPKGRDDQYGYGIVNLVGALTADVPPLRPSTSPTPSTPAAAAPKAGASPFIWLFIGLGVVIALAIVVVAMRLRPARSPGTP
jgi:type VII secretion-associated serine protease mycosin